MEFFNYLIYSSTVSDCVSSEGCVQERERVNVGYVTERVVPRVIINNLLDSEMRRPPRIVPTGPSSKNRTKKKNSKLETDLDLITTGKWCRLEGHPSVFVRPLTNWVGFFHRTPVEVGLQFSVLEG